MGITESKWEDAVMMQQMPGICCEQQRKHHKIFPNRKTVPPNSGIASFSNLQLQKRRERSSSIDDSTIQPTSSSESAEELKTEKAENRFKFRKNHNYARSCSSLALGSALNGSNIGEYIALEGSIATAAQKMNIKPPTYIDRQVIN